MAGYGTDQGFSDWLAANGYSLPDGAPAVPVLRQRGSSYIDAMYGPRFTGAPTDPTQEREWPRTGAYIFGSALADSVVPNRVIEASYRAAYIAATNPSALSVVIDPNRVVKRQKVDTIEREFFEPGARVDGVLTASVSSDIDGLLAPLVTPCRRPGDHGGVTVPGFYNEMADMVQDVLLPDADGGLGQGIVELKRVTTTPGAEEWDPPTETVETWPLKAAVKRVDQRYENGALIVETVDIVTFAVPATVPALTDTLVIDGRERAITSLKPTPSAGTVVAWKAVVSV